MVGRPAFLRAHSSGLPISPIRSPTGSAHDPCVTVSMARAVLVSGRVDTLFGSPFDMPGTLIPARFNGVDRYQAGPNMVAKKSMGLAISDSRLIDASAIARSQAGPCLFTACWISV